VPELVEVERYRRLADAAVGWRVAAVEMPDPTVAVGDLDAALRGRRVVAARRRGKLLMVDMHDGPTLGLRFGMTGTLMLDGSPAIDRLRYAPAARVDRWVRLRVALTDRRGRRRELALCDPRRLGRALLDPDEEALGPDAASATVADLRRALGGSRGAALKALLLDQHRLAGVGNLIADEVLWRSGLDPRRPSTSLSPAELRRLHRRLRSTVDDLVERGGSHTGDLMAERHQGGRCPKDGTPLERSAVGGRTTWWCPRHQR
jgi:formamidopyrimidine-DNA glycosylase